MFRYEKKEAYPFVPSTLPSAGWIGFAFTELEEEREKMQWIMYLCKVVRRHGREP